MLNSADTDQICIPLLGSHSPSSSPPLTYNPSHAHSYHDSGWPHGNLYTEHPRVQFMHAMAYTWGLNPLYIWPVNPHLTLWGGMLHSGGVRSAMRKRQIR